MKKLKIGPGQTGLDPEVAELVWAMNRLPGIKTTNSCCGHLRKRDRFAIWFIVTDYRARGLLTLSRLLSPNYHGYYRHLRVVLDHADTTPQVCWRLEGPSTKGTFLSANKMAAEINALAENRVPYYNILLG